MRIGEKLKEEREKNELSQKDVADRLHVARQSSQGGRPIKVIRM